MIPWQRTSIFTSSSPYRLQYISRTTSWAQNYLSSDGYITFIHLYASRDELIVAYLPMRVSECHWIYGRNITLPFPDQFLYLVKGMLWCKKLECGPRNMCSSKEVITALRMTPSKICGMAWVSKQICDVGFSVTCYETDHLLWNWSLYDRRPIVPYVFSIIVHVIIEEN